MVVPKAAVPKILAGTVTHVRLPLTRWNPKQVDQLRSAHYHRDGDGRITKVTASRVPICRLRVLDHQQVILSDVDDDRAREEGYPTVDALAQAFLDTYRTAWTDTPGWLVTVRPDHRDTPRLLPNQHGARIQLGPDVEDAGQYVESSARAIWDPGSPTAGMRRAPEPEAVDPDVVASGATALEARQRWQRAKLMQEQARAKMPLGERVERELAAARAAGVETWRYERAILARLEALRRRANT